MGSDETTNIKEIRDRIQEFIKARDWEKFHNPKDLAISIGIESAELMEIFQWKTEAQIGALMSDAAYGERITEELADVVIYSLSLANTLDIDVTKAVLNKIETNARKYPQEKAYGRAEKYTRL